MKTLKSFEIPDVAVEGTISRIREEAIKWCLEDRKRDGLTFQGEFWMKRFDLTDKDIEDYAFQKERGQRK